MRKTFLILLMFFALTGFAQQGPDRFDLAFQAHGGGALTTVQSLRITAQSSTGGPSTQPLKISASLDGKLRLDYGQHVNRTEISTPEGGMTILNGKTTWLAPHARAYAQLDLLSIFGIAHLARGIEKTALPPTTISGRPTESVRVATGREQIAYRRIVKDEAEVSFDTETGLVAAISRRQFADESLDLAFTMTTRFSDYRPVANFSLPFRIERYIDGVLREAITVDSFEINPAFEPETFGR